MTDLTDNDVDRIATALAPKLVQCVRDGHHDFWIDPEKHYRDHIEIGRLSEALDADTLAGLKELGKLHAGAKRNVIRFIVGLFLVIALMAAIIYGIFVHAPVKPGA